MYFVSLHGHATSAWPSARAACRPSAGRAPSTLLGGVDLLHPAQHVGAHPGHHPHGGHDVRRVGDLHTEHRAVGLEVTHHEGDDVHGPTPHAPAVEVGHDRLHLVRVHPVVGGPGVLLLHAADVGAVLDARHVGGVGGRVEGVRLLLRVEPGEGAGGHQDVGQLGPLLVRAGAPVHAVRLGELGDLGDPGQDALVGRGCTLPGWCRRSCSPVPLAHSRP